MNQVAWVLVYLVSQDIWGSFSTWALLGCLGLSLQDMTSAAPGSSGPYSDPNRARSLWDPRDVPLQLLPLSGPSSRQIQNSRILLQRAQPLGWVSFLQGVDVQAGLSAWAGTSSGVAWEALSAETKEVQDGQEGTFIHKVRCELVPGLDPLNYSGHVIIFTIKSFLRISEMPTRSIDNRTVRSKKVNFLF